MGYNDGAGPEGTPAFTNTPQTTADFNRLRDLVVQRGNVRKGDNSTRTNLASPEAVDGLIWNDTTTGLTYKRVNGAWRLLDGGLLCRYPLAAQQTGVAGTMTLLWSATATVDTGGFRTSSSEFTIPITGLYRVSAGIITTGTIARQALLSVNGANGLRIGGAVGASGAPSHISATYIDNFPAGTKLRLQVLDASAGLVVLDASWCAIELLL